MSDKEIYMKDLKRAYDVFQWLQINTDNIKKLYDVMESIDLTKLVTQEQFEELVRETPTIARLVENVGKLQLQLEHDTNVLDIDTNFGHTLLNFIFGKNEYRAIFYVDYLNISDGSTSIIIENCYLCSTVAITSPSDLTQTLKNGNFKFIGLNGYGNDGLYTNLPIACDTDGQYWGVMGETSFYSFAFGDTFVDGANLISLIDNSLIEV